MSKLRFFNIFFLKPGLTKTFYLVIDFENSLDGAATFMLENLTNLNLCQNSVFSAFFFLNQV